MDGLLRAIRNCLRDLKARILYSDLPKFTNAPAMRSSRVFSTACACRSLSLGLVYPDCRTNSLHSTATGGLQRNSILWRSHPSADQVCRRCVMCRPDELLRLNTAHRTAALVSPTVCLAQRRRHPQRMCLWYTVYDGAGCGGKLGSCTAP